MRPVDVVPPILPSSISSSSEAAAAAAAILGAGEPSMPGSTAPAAGRVLHRGSAHREVSTAMIGVPTSTISPSETSSPVTVPANGTGSSTSDLAVSISTMMSLTLTVSPTLTFQVTISASVRPSPGSGRLNSLTDMGFRVPSQKASERSTASSTLSRSGRNSSSSLLGG